MSEYDYELDLNETKCGENCTLATVPPALPEIGHRHYIVLTCYAIVFLLGVPGNGLVVWVTAFRMPRSVNALWFLNLAIADLLCCLSVPLIMVPLAQDKHWPFGLAACKLVHGLLYMLMYCSVLLLVLISLDRWLLVSRPTWCQNWRRPRYASWVCLVIWILALVISIPQFNEMEVDRRGSKIICAGMYGTLLEAWSITVFRFLVGFFMPFLVICVSHWMVYQRAGRGPGQNKRSARTVRVILAIVLSFFLCWLPLHIMDFLQMVAQKNTEIQHNVLLFRVLALCLAYFNSCLNPLLYVCLGRGFRDSLTKTLRSVLHFASEEPPRGLSMTGNTKSTTDSNHFATENRVH
ncbi:C5a anaphylatoxin chemotactic receptor 1 [Colossoma macropomum]|uniref:C5a anaphylatoxin chemotactic receptor 1 n=1 Tax=Colossoma macropomum TaxID=42526 RepID=UPI001863B65C|nr:C5a anaphylatoxin chemotactic receptor 1 [Colossoma macropomum]